MAITQFDFYQQEFSALMRAICGAIGALDREERGRARAVLANAWDDAVALSYQTFIAKTAQ